MRTTYCGKLNTSYIGKNVTLYGWVQHYRNLGNIIFIDLRDREGIVQIFFEKKINKQIYQEASELRNEFCIKVKGIVYERPNYQKNKNIYTGDIEIYANYLKIINDCEKLPIDIYQKNNYEENRLKYRYLDIRRLEMINRLKIRAKIFTFIRKFMEDHHFLEIETPILTHATPEGARNYFVPSRIHSGKYYALPQSPQLFKQLLMISGVDRYYQIAKCFRDEDLRSDRQPEFTQLDIETSFMSTIEIREIIEKLICNLWKEILGINLDKFPVITFSESLYRFGTDKPDLRNTLELVDISNLITNDKNYAIAIKIPYTIALTRKIIENCRNYIYTMYSIKEISWFKVKENLNNINKSIVERTKAKKGDVIFLSSTINDNKKTILNAMSALRLKIGNEIEITKKNECKPLWIIDFPMFEYDNDNRLTSVHHPFTAPKDINQLIYLKNNPCTLITDSYDLVINGYEIGGGSARIHKKEIQEIVFNILGISKEEQKKKFGFFIEALKYGTPHHAGIALGLDRLVMLLTETDNIKDVIAFPKSTNASCLLTNAPSFIK